MTVLQQTWKEAMAEKRRDNSRFMVTCDILKAIIRAHI